MPIKLSELKAEPVTAAAKPELRSLEEAAGRGKTTAFLSHSHADEEAAKRLQSRLKKEGVDLYIDWQDGAMPATPDKDTADRIKNKITQASLFLFLATKSSTSSRWCPWEIGYADGKKNPSSIIIIPTEEDNNHYGNEYLQLYRKIDFSGGRLALFESGGLEVHPLASVFR